MITILIIILFIVFVGPQAPVVRAGFMGIVTLVAILYGKRNLALHALFLSALFIALFWPMWIGTISFQLSFGATLGIILFGGVKTTKPKNPIEKIKQTIWKDLKPSLAAQVFTVPIIFFSFKQISLISPFSNLLVAGTVPPLMIFGFLTAILGKIHYSLGLIPSYVCYGLLTYAIFVIEILTRIPFIFFRF